MPEAKRVPVCLKCGNRDIRPQTIREGLWAGGGEALGWWTCDRCNHIGVPLLVDAAEAPPPEGDRRWDEPAAATPEPGPEEPAPARSPQPVLGGLLLVLAFLLTVPIVGLSVIGAYGTGFWGLIVSFAGSLFGLVLGYAVARIGWRM